MVKLEYLIYDMIWQQDYRQLHLSGWHKRKIKKNPTKFQKVKKILLTLKIFKSAANAISFYSETPYLSIYVSETFTQKGKAQIKKRETCGPPLLLGVIKIQKRFGYISLRFGVKLEQRLWGIFSYQFYTIVRFEIAMRFLVRIKIWATWDK